MFKKILLFTLILCEISFCYKILVVFPYPRKSHFILGEGYVRHLLRAGHEVTYITPSPVQPAPSLRQIEIASIMGLIRETNIVKDYIQYKNATMPTLDLLQFMMKVVYESALHPNVQKLINDTREHFDAVIIEYMFAELLSGLASVYDCPLIWSVSMEAINAYICLIDDPENPAYTTTIWNNNDAPFTFWTRVQQLYALVRSRLYKWLMYSQENEIFMKAFGEAFAKRGRSLPSYDSVRYNASLVLGNSNRVMDQPKYLPPAYKEIGGYHIKDQVEPLPEDLATIMNNAEHGVIYFSLGSILRSEDLSNDTKTELLEVFRNLKQTIIWKLANSIGNIPKNVHIVRWAPQQSILAHHNCVLFITHGGLLSMTEAMHAGIPVIGIPVFADQFVCINRAVNKGYGRRVDMGLHLARDLKIAIEEMVDDPSYMEKVKEYSALYHHRSIPPGVELVHSVEHVILSRGAPHLRSPALQVPYYQKMYLDLAFLIVAIVWIVIKLFKLIFVSIKRYTIKIKRA